MDKSYETDDCVLIRKLRARDSEVFSMVFNEYWSKLYISAYNILRDREQAEDVVQEVFTHLWNQGDQLKIKNLSAWLFTAVRYQVFNIIRSGKVKKKYKQNYVQEIEVENIAEEKLNNEEIRKRLLVAIDALPSRCKKIFVLSRIEFLSHKEIAKKLNISEKTVENQITIALKRLRNSLADMLFVFLFLSLENTLLQSI